MVEVTITEEERERLRREFDAFLDEVEKSWRKYTAEHPARAIIYCQATYSADFEDTKKCVERVSPHVDYTVIVEDGSLTDDQRERLKQQGCIVKTVMFADNLPAFRNAYIEEAKKIDPYGWVLVSDPDELMSQSLCEELRNIVKALEEHGYNMAGINCHEAFESVEWLDDLDLLKEAPAGYRRSKFWKNLLFKLAPDLHYEGVGKTKTVHETWYCSIPWRSVNLHERFWYEHRKSALKIWRNAARNLFMGGGGDNVGDLNPYWVELRRICDELGIREWGQFEEYLTRGKVDERLKNWLTEALQAPATNYGTETRETAKWYFAMHKDEVTPMIMERIKTLPPMPKESEVEAWVTKCYFDILGRHPDEEGLRAYTEHILAGRVKREDLPNILMQSQEYREKFGHRR